MADEIAAAVIQGVSTIVAAGIAVRGVRAGLDAWRKQAPGRRRLELAEECLALAYDVHGRVEAFAFDVNKLMRDELREGNKFRREALRDNQNEIASQRRKLSERIDELESKSRITDLYFGLDLLRGWSMMQEYFRNRNEMRYDFERLCDSVEGPTAEKEAVFKAFEPSYLTPEGNELYKLRKAPIEFYERALKPHLGVLADRKQTGST